MAAFCFFPVFRARPHRCSTVARAMPRLSATTATDRASEGSAGRLKSTIGIRASFAARIIGMMLFASFGTTMIPSTPRATKPRTCSSCRLASPSAMASSIPSCDFPSSVPDGVDARHPELGLQRLEGDAHRSRSAVALARAGAGDPDAHCHQKSRRRPRPHRHRCLPGSSSHGCGGFRIDSSCARTSSGSKTFLQSGWKSLACASRSILRAPSE